MTNYDPAYCFRKMFLFVILLLLMSSNFSFAQPNIEWDVAYGGSSLEAGHTVLPTADGGYVVAASALSDDGDVGGNQGEYDYWIVKLNAEGSLIWESNFGGGDDERVSDIIEMSDGGFMVAGTTLSTDGDISVKYGPLFRDGWIIRLDANGNLLWDKTIGGTEDDNPISMIGTADGGVIVALTSRSSNIDVSLNFGKEDIWLAKLNSSGDIDWEKSYGGSENDRPAEIVATSDGGYVVSGWTESSDELVSNNYGESDYWVFKINEVGELQWEENYGGTGIDKSSALQSTLDGGFVMVGTSNSTDGDISNPNGGLDAWLIKIDANGNILLEKSYGGLFTEYGLSVQSTPDGGFIFLLKNTELLKVDAAGNEEWNLDLEVTSVNLFNLFFSVKNTPDGGYILTGSQGPNANDQVFVVKFEGNMTSPCPTSMTGFTSLGEFGNSKYFLSESVAQPSDAQSIAEQNGGYLAVINDQAENDFIQQNISIMAYIGLNDVNAEGNLLWVNGDALNYDNIDPCSFCNENSNDLDYVIIAPWDGAWSFSSQWNQRKYIVEVPCGSILPSMITLNCPNDITVTADANTGLATINYSDATGSTDCPNGGLSILNTGILGSGTEVGVGVYSISFVASDACGSTEECFFNITVEAGNTGGGCPSDITGFTTLGEFGNSKYYLSNENAQPADAQATAEANGGYLAVINDQAENDFIQQGISEFVYIGLNDAQSEGNLTWVNGDPLNYNNINPCNFCNENTPDLDYAMMQPWDGGWSFSSVWNQRKYVMEVPCNTNQPDPITIFCPDDITITTDPTTGLATLNYNLPTVIVASSFTPCVGFNVFRAGGPKSGDELEPGIYTVSFVVADNCENYKSCLMNILVVDANVIPTDVDIIYDCPTSFPNDGTDWVLPIEITNNTNAPANGEEVHLYLERTTSNGYEPIHYGSLTFPNLAVGESFIGEIVVPASMEFFLNNNLYHFTDGTGDVQMGEYILTRNSSGLNPDRKVNRWCNGTSVSNIGVEFISYDTTYNNSGIVQYTVSIYNSGVSDVHNVRSRIAQQETDNFSIPLSPNMIEISGYAENEDYLRFNNFSYVMLNLGTILAGESKEVTVTLNLLDAQTMFDSLPDSYNIGVGAGGQLGSPTYFGDDYRFKTAIKELVVPNDCSDVITGFSSLGEFNGHKYFLSSGVATPAAAQQVAEQNGGYLAVINDQAENDFIQQNISDLVYIGLDDVQNEGTPQWINGDALGFENFNICNFCNENSAEMDYVVMHQWDGGWSWSNEFNQRKYIVEIPCTVSCYPLGITFSTQADVDQFPIDNPNCTAISGRMFITGGTVSSLADPIVDLSPLSNITYVGGDVLIFNNQNLANLSGLENLTEVGGYFTVSRNDFLTDLSELNISSANDIRIRENAGLERIGSFHNITNLEGDLWIFQNSNLQEVDGFSSLTSVGGEFSFYENHVVSDMSDFSNLLTIGEELRLNNQNELTSMEGFNSLHSVGSLEIENNNSLVSLNGLESLTTVNGDFILSLLPALADISALSGLTTIPGDLWITGTHLSDLNGLQGLTEVNGEIRIGNDHLTSLNGLENVTGQVEGLIIWFNDVLTDISAIQNIEIGPVLRIEFNPLLSICHESSVCDFFDSTYDFLSIQGNAVGCESEAVVENICSTLLQNPSSNQGSFIQSSGSDLLDVGRISIFPNPADDQIVVHLYSSFLRNKNLEIFDARGVLLKTKEVNLNVGNNSFEVSISDFSDGIYFLKIPSLDGKVISKRFVKIGN